MAHHQQALRAAGVVWTRVICAASSVLLLLVTVSSFSSWGAAAQPLATILTAPTDVNAALSTCTTVTTDVRSCKVTFYTARPAWPVAALDVRTDACVSVATSACNRLSTVDTSICVAAGTQYQCTSSVTVRGPSSLPGGTVTFSLVSREVRAQTFIVSPEYPLYTATVSGFTVAAGSTAMSFAVVVVLALATLLW